MPTAAEGQVRAVRVAENEGRLTEVDELDPYLLSMLAWEDIGEEMRAILSQPAAADRYGEE